MTKYFPLSLATPLLLLAKACSTPKTSTSGDLELDVNARAALQPLFDSKPKARGLRYRAKSVLVCLDVVKMAFIAGAEGGKGLMFCADDKVVGYYTVRALSYGL